MKNTTPPFIVNDDILTAGPTRQLLMRWKNGKKNALLAPPLLSSAHPPWQEASTPVMRESDFATEQFKYAMYVIKCILSSLSSITSSSSLLVDIRYTRKTFPFQNLECHLQVYFIVDLICLSPYEHFIFLKNF